MKRLLIPLTAAFIIFVIIIIVCMDRYTGPQYPYTGTPPTSIQHMLKANSFCVSLPNTDHAWDLSDRYAINTGDGEVAIEILVTTPEEARDQANLRNEFTAKVVAQDLARQNGYVAFKIKGVDDRLFTTSPLNID